jgi:proteasome assembly chaperone (PAC2) family protein
MQSAIYYREQALKAARLAFLVGDAQAKAQLGKMAWDYRDIAIDLENGAIDVRHPERMPQLKDAGQAEPGKPPER